MSVQRALFVVGVCVAMAFFPAFMLICYLALFFYFKSRGGYSAQVLTGHKANDDKFTGGVPGSASF